MTSTSSEATPPLETLISTGEHVPTTSLIELQIWFAGHALPEIPRHPSTHARSTHAFPLVGPPQSESIEHWGVGAQVDPPAPLADEDVPLPLDVVAHKAPTVRPTGSLPRQAPAVAKTMAMMAKNTGRPDRIGEEGSGTPPTCHRRKVAPCRPLA
jgi:hypothetical protein